MMLMLLTVAVSLSACAIQTIPAPGPVPANYFGMHLHRTVVPQPWMADGDRLTPWPDVKFGSWRLWDAYVAWPNLEPEKGHWKFATLDKYVAMASLAKVDVLLPLGLSPPWASVRPGEASSYKPGNAAEPRDLEDWRNYVRTVATRYKGRVRAYEIWNEPNLKGFYSGSPETMVQMARIAYETLKAIDPEIIVVSPSATGDGRNPEWLDNYLAKGGGQYADVIGYHFYVPKDSPEAMLPVIKKVQQIMQKQGVADKPLWNTETGWWIANKTTTRRIGAAGADWRNLDDGQAAAYVARALILSWSAGVSRIYWYAWDNHDMGLIDASDKSVKPAGRAFAQTREWMLGAIFKNCIDTDALWVCELSMANGGKARLVWRQSGSDQEWSVPTAWAARQAEMLNGEMRELSPGTATLLLGQSPVLVR
ncbi:MAG: GH39 family glycosyl hydrolase [Thiobacillus sp.]